ncbi:CHAT domain-containing protein [Streptomyces sp. NPDC127068]|uniref:CHAT domain-containing protein n=1 Tax=Streptomyces sp. NPDC127068 TaxID=3347127 RepID=UPI00365539B2
MERSHRLRAVRERLVHAEARSTGREERPTDADDDVHGLFGPAADADVAALLRVCDLTTDLEVRWAVGWFYWARCAELGAGRGTREGSCAGTLLFPVWAVDPGAVPEELATAFADLPPDQRPGPGPADGPVQWHVVCESSVAAAQEQLPPQGPRPDDGPSYVDRLKDLAEQVRALVGIDLEQLLWTGVASGTLAVLATQRGAPEHALRMDTLAAALSTLSRVTGEAAPLDEAADLGHRAVKASRTDDPDRPVRLNNHGLVLVQRYEMTSDPEDLYEATGIARDVLDGTPPDHADRARYASSLARALSLCTERDGGTPDQHDEIVDLLRRAVPGDPNGRGAALLNLGVALLRRSRRAGRPADLEEAVTVLTEAREESGGHPALRSQVGEVLASVLRAHHAHTGRPEDLATARHLMDAARATGPEPAPRTAGRLINTALELRARYTAGTSGPEVLREAVQQLRDAVALFPAEHVRRPAALHDLGSVLITAHQSGTDTTALPEAVAALRESVRRTPRGHAELGGRLMTLGTALGLRHATSDDSGDLREAMECRRRAAELPGLPGEQRAAVLVASGTGALHAVERTQDPHTVEQAIEQIRAGIALTPPTDPKWHRRRMNLALALLTAFHLTGRRTRLKEARTLIDAVLAALPEGAPDRSNALMAAATLRLAGERVAWSSTVRRDAVALMRQAVRATPEGNPRRAGRLASLGAALTVLYVHTRARPDLREAADALRAAALDPHGAPATRLEAARGWGRAWLALGRPDRAVEGFTAAVDLLPAVSPRHLVREDQEFRLSQAVGLGAEAAACAVHHGDPGLAVRLLEQARGVLLAQAFDADSDLTELAARAPDLAARFARLRDHVDATTDERRTDPDAWDTPTDTASGTITDTAPGGAELRGRAAAEWNELIGRIRAEHPALRLFRPVREWDESELRATAAEGPVVLLYVPPAPELPGPVPTAPDGGALIVTTERIEAVPLPGLTAREAEGRTRHFQEALSLLADPNCPRDRALSAQAAVRDTLDWLWSAVTGPVLRQLDRTHPTGPGQLPPRIWWSPGGALAALPLHAAAPDGTGPGALDRAVSSYVPTLRALHHARTRERGRRTAPGRPLLVSVPEAEGLPPLPGARGETQRLAALLRDATVLDGEAATGAAVRAHLPDHPYAHFACHAVSDPQRPSHTRLALHGPARDSPTVRDLARWRLPHARLAYLSACDTLRTSPALADESVHIVSALQMAGFPHVVGSLWNVDDTIGARVAHAVYERLVADGGPPAVAGTAHALHQAVCALRADYPRTPSLWACQVHAGP